MKHTRFELGTFFSCFTAAFFVLAVIYGAKEENVQWMLYAAIAFVGISTYFYSSIHGSVFSAALFSIFTAGLLSNTFCAMTVASLVLLRDWPFDTYFGYVSLASGTTFVICSIYFRWLHARNK